MPFFCLPRRPIVHYFSYLHLNFVVFDFALVAFVNLFVTVKREEHADPIQISYLYQQNYALKCLHLDSVTIKSYHFEFTRAPYLVIRSMLIF